MTNYIIVSVGSWGVKTRPRQSWKSPRPGDVVDFGENTGEYPFIYGQYGRIDNVGWWAEGEVSICCELGSAFLLEGGEVSISGGPFTSVRLDQLVLTTDLMSTTFWNWGDHHPGAHMGVEYGIDRPLWLLKKQGEAT